MKQAGKEHSITCMMCVNANTANYGFAVCYAIGATLNGKLVAKKKSLSNKACAKYKPLEATK